MINANELRRGNWVAIPECGIVAQIDIIGAKKVCIDVDPVDLDKNQNDFELSSIHPIPLSPDILEKAGFVCVNSRKNSDIFSYAFKEDNHDLKFYPPNTLYWRGYAITIEHLHQLQNCWPFLTGTELTITL